jgi:hypothetical protein
VLEAWKDRDPALMRRTTLMVESVHQHCHRDVFDQQSAQENHRGFADAVLERVQRLEHAQRQSHAAAAPAAEEALPSLMLLMLKSERELASEAIRQERLRDVLPLFRPYVAGVPL